MNQDHNQPELNEQEVSKLAKETKETAPTQEFFKEIVQGLPEEKVKKEIPNLDKASKNDTIEPVKTATDQEKIDAYDKLKEKNPQEVQAEITQLAEKQVATETNYQQKVNELAADLDKSDFYDDFAQRPTLTDNEKLKQELVKEQDKVQQLQEKIKSLKGTINQFIENEKTKKYVLANPIVNPQQVNQAIPKLLEDVEKR
ncbi:6972_t:CDS:2 [Ambispora leptoticha]|uniref:6972_t:CDS:1 n=1 Tax=Ambispora leptoticha TaxID=144679 RepID=A0A9N8V7Q6_9GLOM|nr:6972_t:CDS:2 [Ambispora leptoticha]